MNVDVARMRADRQRLMEMRAADRNVTVVVGPPCSGKTTYVAMHAADRDVIVDFDALAVALGSRMPWGHARGHLDAAHAARDGVIARALRTRTDHAVWVILTQRSQASQFGLVGSRVVEMDTPLDECERRAMAQGRPPSVIQIIRDWRSAG